MISKLRKFSQWIPGKTHGGRLVWFWHLLAVVLLWRLLHGWKIPTDWVSDATTPKPNKFGDVFKMGIWHGAWVHLIISLVLVSTVRWWSQRSCATRETKLSGNTPRRTLFFWLSLGVIIIAALGLRWPRMDLSYWGDEGWAVREYVHGEWVPKEKGNYQGELRFMPVPWRHLIFDDKSGGNHFLFSILQKLTLDAWRSQHGLPEWAFDETISRLPLLAAGLCSLAVFALFFKWLGHPIEGLCGALYLAMHPWHIRYSTEARGYMLMMLFFLLAVWALLWAVRVGRWRAWLTFAGMQLLAIYSWKVAAIPLCAVNAVAALYLLLGRAAPLRERLSAVSRLVVVGLSMTGLFAMLYAVPSLQHPRAMERLTRTGKPMDIHWLKNSLSGLLIGCPWDRSDYKNPTETPMGEFVTRSPVKFGIGVFAAVGIMLTGLARLYRRHFMHCLIWVGVFACAAAGAAVFKWIMGIEWIFWYSFFALLPMAVFHSMGMGWLFQKMATQRGPLGPVWMGLVTLLSVSVYALSIPQIRLLQTQSYESNRESFYATRGRHEPWNYAGPSKIITCYLWRQIWLYDPRGDSYVRTKERLYERMAEADKMGGELYYVVGSGPLFRHFQKDVAAELDNTQLFEKLDTFWAQEAVHTQEIYRYLGKLK